jgi:hypothetical protein
MGMLGRFVVSMGLVLGECRSVEAIEKMICNNGD